jgi:3-hydroxyisobutyrate dehydrogenase
VEVLDAPVAGQSVGAEAGTLSIYVGGSEEAFERGRPLLEAMGNPRRIFHVGDNGAGYTVKLLLNLLWFIQSVATGEVLSTGVRAGVSLEKLYEALVGSPANTNFLEHDVRSVLDAGDYDEAFPMRLVTKDLGLAVDLAREVGVPVELAALVEQIHRRARIRFGDQAGEISAIRLYEELAGVELRLAAGSSEPS